ncbi:MAG: carbohydrate porin [Limisphaerales bacterium]
MKTKQNLSRAAGGFVFIVGFASLFTALSATTAAKAQSLTNQEQTAAPPVSSPPVDSGFADKMTGGWSGQRQWLEDKGISLNAQLILEGFYNFQGGVKTGDTWASTFDLNLTLDTEKAFNWKGGTFYADLEDHAGRNPTADLTGDLQAFDKLNTARYLQIYELWYQQALFNDWLRLKLGKWDANDDFSVIDNGLAFLNASDIVSPTILAFPTTPDPMPGAAVYLTPGKFWYAQFGVFYANQSDTFGDITGHPQSIQPTDYGALLIGETGLRWDHAPLLGKDGNLKFGAWGHTGTFTRFDGSQQKGAEGYYAIFDQTLWQPHGEPEQGRGLRSFLEAGQTQASVSAIDWNAAGGITWTGPLAVRPDDILGFSANYAHLSPQAGLSHSYELALEWFYQLPLTKWATLHPDFQFIVHPGGQYPDAVVGTLDLTIQF